MQKIKISILVAIVALFSNCSDRTKSGQIQLTTFKDSLSYSFGTLLAEQIKPQLEDIDIATVTAAFKEALSDTSQLTLEQCQQVYMSFNEKKTESLGEEGKIYLAENATKEGVETTASGLQYKILQAGTGDYPSAESTVTVHYTGTLIDGTVFDSSVERGEPISFPLSGVIPGWTEGVQLINVGGKIELTIPYELGYGERGSGPIPPRSVLIFEVELIAIES
ncbi:MAG: peptidylprolyl isomerase [Flammeovirgaceae bacterium]|nr:peptidylprolyl isomerase [Flammeovirgaceae bacterium]|tara:strand:+ start:315 stop:980 length:666 start_codon:yes stop_codon:yes gene_type:complete